MGVTTEVEISDLPSRGRPEQLLIAIDRMKEGGPKGVGGLEDEIEEYGSRNLTDNLKLGVVLGFVNREGNDVTLTDTGFELAFAQDEEDEEKLTELFKNGLNGAEPYLEFLRALQEDSDKPYDSLIRNSDILQLLRTKFSFTESSEAKLKRVASILFETLDYAGYGEMKEAGGGYPTRFSFSQEWDLSSVLIDLQDEVEDRTETTDESIDNRGEEQDDEETEKSQIITNGEELQRGEEKEIEQELGGLTIDEKKPQNTHITQNVDITVNIDLDMNDMDTAEFEKKIEHLKELFKND